MPDHDELHGSGEEPAPKAEPAPTLDFLDQLYHNVLRGLSEFVGHPLTQPSTTVRGIVRPSARSVRVFLLTNSDFDSSVAIDIPLVDARGSQYTHGRVAALLRTIVSGEYVDIVPAAETMVGTSSITVYDARTVIDSVIESDAFEDYVRRTLYGLLESRSPSVRGHENELTPAGFMILDESVVRYYFDLPGGQVTVGVDCPLRAATFLRIRIKELFDTGVMEGLLVPGTRDSYCQLVYHATDRL